MGQRITIAAWQRLNFLNRILDTQEKNHQYGKTTTDLDAIQELCILARVVKALPMRGQQRAFWRMMAEYNANSLVSQIEMCQIVRRQLSMLLCFFQYPHESPKPGQTLGHKPCELLLQNCHTFIYLFLFIYFNL